MKKITISILITFYSLFSFSQKKELYVNDDFKYITKTEFDRKSDHPLGYNLRFDLDSCYLNVKVSRYIKGKIKLSLLDSIKTSFNKFNQIKLDDSDALFVNYYPGDDNCSSRGYKANFKKRYNEFYRNINKIENLKQLFIYKSDDGLRGFGKKINWQPDINNLIENTFYPIHYPCGGYLIIDSKGNYISERGEYCYSKILIKELKTFASNSNN
ncbi:hypothetical protein VOI54_03230 [Tamlana sp. 2201CG12-4]|uniref:hypothetical protein n=1 Tax=Tamlana sp. 2201CG12-4 TaxID=3112582 RepID=UPI002DB56F06|nr:hypothetical protein [Tamlana sp. 2201CG12-4]MEC3906013.1 hypothetical protein [Tamlana sp. 2201CG12-4]